MIRLAWALNPDSSVTVARQHVPRLYQQCHQGRLSSMSQSLHLFNNFALLQCINNAAAATAAATTTATTAAATTTTTTFGDGVWTDLAISAYEAEQALPLIGLDYYHHYYSGHHYIWLLLKLKIQNWPETLIQSKGWRVLAAVVISVLAALKDHGKCTRQLGKSGFCHRLYIPRQQRHQYSIRYKQEVKVIWQKAPHRGPIPRLNVTPGVKICTIEFLG